MFFSFALCAHSKFILIISPAPLREVIAICQILLYKGWRNASVNRTQPNLVCVFVSEITKNKKIPSTTFKKLNSTKTLLGVISSSSVTITSSCSHSGGWFVSVQKIDWLMAYSGLSMNIWSRVCANSLQVQVLSVMRTLVPTQCLAAPECVRQSQGKPGMEIWEDVKHPWNLAATWGSSGLLYHPSTIFSPLALALAPHYVA